MSRLLLSKIIFVALCLLVGILVALSKRQQQPIHLDPSFATDFAYDNSSFLSAMVLSGKEKIKSPAKIIVIPHHLTASPLIVTGLKSLSAGDSPKTIFVVSPNHANMGNCDIVTSTKPWSTPYGVIEIDQEALAQIAMSKTVCIDDTAFENEHGIAGLLPFIKYLYPEASIVPFAIKKYIDLENLDQFITQLSSLNSDSNSFVFSIDFSHGLSLQASQIKDDQTIKLIETENFPEISKLTQAHVDSPASLIVALKLAQNIGTKMSILDHKDSSFYNHSKTSVTTYFFLASMPSPASISSTPSQPSHSRPDRESIQITPTSNTISLIFGGDVMLARSVNTRMIKYGDYTWPFLKIADRFRSADIAMINLESPIKSGCKPTDSGMIFCADPKSLAGLIFAGIDVASLANNHILNQGKTGLEETLQVLTDADIAPIGIGKSFIKAVRGTKIAYLGFNDIGASTEGVSSASKDTIRSQVEKAKTEADIVVTTIHWGNEYSKRSLRQQELAHLAIDSGADIVIGHHPHWVQEFEEYKGKPVYYSLGNLVFDQMWSTETRKGLVVKITLSGGKVINREELPVMIYDYGQPSFL